MLEEASHNELNRRSSEIKQTKPKASNFFLPIYQKKANFSSQILQEGKKKKKLEKSNTNHDLSKVESFEIEIEKEREKFTLDDDFTLINDNREKCQRGNTSGNSYKQRSEKGVRFFKTLRCFFRAKKVFGTFFLILNE
jgi:phage repressor protein C with HTH and peptisase S24 domain